MALEAGIDFKKTETERQALIGELGKILVKEDLAELVKKSSNWTEHWNLYLEKLIKINREILEIVDFCIDEDRTLWVIGY